MADEYYTYTTLQGDTWDSISLDFYDDERKTQVLMEANPDHIKTLVFAEGVQLTVPVIEDSVSETLPPWKQG